MTVVVVPVMVPERGGMVVVTVVVVPVMVPERGGIVVVAVVVPVIVPSRGGTVTVVVVVVPVIVPERGGIVVVVVVVVVPGSSIRSVLIATPAVFTGSISSAKAVPALAPELTATDVRRAAISRVNFLIFSFLPFLQIFSPVL